MTDEQRDIRQQGRFGPLLLLSLLLLLAGAGLGLLALTGRPVTVPGWIVAQVQTRVNAALDGKAELDVGSVQLLIDSDFEPRVRLLDLDVLDAKGREIASLPEMRVRLSAAGLLRGRIQPVELQLSGASLALRRNAQGRLDLALGQGAPIGENRPETQPAETQVAETQTTEAQTAAPAAPQQEHMTSLGGLLQRVDGALQTPLLAGLKRVQSDAMSVTMRDARAGRTWRISDGRLTLVQTSGAVSVELGFGIGALKGPPAQAVMTFVTQKNSPEARISVRVDRVPSADVAAQSPALTFLKVIDAPISGDLHASVDASGQISGLEGALNVGAGHVAPGAATQPIPFESAALAFSYNPEARKLVFTRASVQSAQLRVTATGQAYLHDMDSGLPKSILGQVTISDVKVDPKGLFVEPVRFSQGHVDLRLKLDPFDLNVGQLVLVEGDRRIQLSGDFKATEKGWQAKLDSHLNKISSSQLLALWPVSVIPQTREWLSDNVQAGLLFNVQSALRLTPGEQPNVSLTYEFTDADVRFLKTLPPIRAGRGYASIQGNTYTMVVDQGHIEAPKGGNIDVAGSTFTVPDIGVKPPPAVVHLKTSSSITAALSLLDEPPFQFLTKAGRPVDLAQGHAELDTVLKLPLADHVAVEDVDFNVKGALTGVSSDTLVKNRTVTADRLDVKVDTDTLTISGAGHLGKVPFDMVWTQGLKKSDGGNSHLSGTVTLSQAFVDEFHIGLAPGTVTGSGTGKIEMDLQKDGPGSFTLTSDMAGVGLSLPAIGWSKPAAQTGTLEVGGSLGDPVAISKLVLKANGLSATGKVALNKDGSLDRVSFSRVQVGNWLSAPVDLVGEGKGIAVVVRGGTLDLQKAKFGEGGGSTEPVPIRVTLNRLTVTSGIQLTGFHGNFTTAGGFNGNFAADVNGLAPIAGTIVPSTYGSAVRIQAADAGRVIAAAGISDRGRGGELNLSLVPYQQKGNYQGHLDITNARVIRAPTLAKMLEAISIVGLLDQLNGPGISFNDIQADFRLTPRAIEVSKGSATGPSMGLSIAGLYYLQNETFDMQGVFSPIYILNGIGSLVMGKGEGLLGFNYTVKGTAAAPQISVNPLSVLTPGFLRDMFRGPAPTLKTAPAPQAKK